AEDGIRDFHVTGVQTCALPIFPRHSVVTGARATSFRHEESDFVTEHIPMKRPPQSEVAAFFANISAFCAACSASFTRARNECSPKLLLTPRLPAPPPPSV